MPVVLNSNQAYQAFMKEQGSCGQSEMWREEKGLMEEEQEAKADEGAVVARPLRSSKRSRPTVKSNSDEVSHSVPWWGVCVLLAGCLHFHVSTGIISSQMRCDACICKGRAQRHVCGRLLSLSLSLTHSLGCTKLAFGV